MFSLESERACSISFFAPAMSPIINSVLARRIYAVMSVDSLLPVSSQRAIHLLDIAIMFIMSLFSLAFCACAK